MEVSETIRKLREQTGLSRKDFSEHIGIPLRTIEDWEAGRRKPPEYIPRLIGYQFMYEQLIREAESKMTCSSNIYLDYVDSGDRKDGD